MQRLEGGSAVPAHLRGGIVALGNFDGFHKGHQAVVGRAVERARAERRPVLVATFDPHPVRFFKPDVPPFRLTTLDQRERLFAAAGADAEVGGAVQNAPVRQPATHRVDAVFRAQIASDAEVCRRVSDLPAAPVAMLDHAFDGEGAGEEAGGRFAIARLQRLADEAGRDRLSIGHDRSDGVDLEALPAPQCL